MARLVLTILGWFIILASFVIIWLTSGHGRLTLTRVGIDIPDLTPRDVGVYFNLVFALGFVFLAGTTIETVFGGISRALTGGSADYVVWSFKEKVLFGALGYVAMAALFGLYLIFFAFPGERTLDRFTDPLFVEFILTWPYQLLAVIRPFDLTPSSFH